MDKKELSYGEYSDLQEDSGMLFRLIQMGLEQTDVYKKYMQDYGYFGYDEDFDEEENEEEYDDDE